MGPFDAIGHLLNLVLPAFGVAAGAALAAKLLWRRELAGVPFLSLLSSGAAGGLVALLGSLAAFGHDGTMPGYALLVTACALSQWWRGFGPGRR